MAVCAVVRMIILCIEVWVFSFAAPGHKHVPDWVWIVVGILNFIAYTLGKKLANIHFSQWLVTLSARIAIH